MLKHLKTFHLQKSPVETIVNQLKHSQTLVFRVRLIFLPVIFLIRFPNVARNLSTFVSKLRYKEAVLIKRQSTRFLSSSPSSSSSSSPGSLTKAYWKSSPNRFARQAFTSLSAFRYSNHADPTVFESISRRSSLHRARCSSYSSWSYSSVAGLFPEQCHQPRLCFAHTASTYPSVRT